MVSFGIYINMIGLFSEWVVTSLDFKLVKSKEEWNIFSLANRNLKKNGRKLKDGHIADHGECGNPTWM